MGKFTSVLNRWDLIKVSRDLLIFTFNIEGWVRFAHAHKVIRSIVLKTYVLLEESYEESETKSVYGLIRPL